MAEYVAPLKDMRFVLEHVVGLDQVNTLPGWEEVTDDVVDAVLEEAAKFAHDVISPLNVVGDRQGGLGRAGGRLAELHVQDRAAFRLQGVGDARQADGAERFDLARLNGDGHRPALSRPRPGVTPGGVDAWPIAARPLRLAFGDPPPPQAVEDPSSKCSTACGGAVREAD